MVSETSQGRYHFFQEHLRSCHPEGTPVSTLASVLACSEGQIKELLIADSMNANGAPQGGTQG